MHIAEGDLRAFLDNELPEAQRRQVANHLEQCADCQAQRQALQTRARNIGESLATISGGPPAGFIPAGQAHRKFEQRLTHPRKEPITMQKQLNRIPRGAWIGLALVAVLAVALAFPSVQAVANSFLSLFRVQQFQVIEFDPESVSGDFENSEQFEALFAESVEIEGGGEPREVSSEELASSMDEMPVRLLEGMQGPQRFMVKPASVATFTLNLELLRAVLKDMQRSDIELPGSLDGARVKLYLPAMLVATYGPCAVEPTGDPDERPFVDPEDCITLLQGKSPSIDAPPDLDLVQLGEVYLQLLGMGPEEASSFAAQVDWTSTLIVPLPRNEAEHTQVSVDGVTGTLILSKTRYDRRYALLWVKDDRFFALSGIGDAQKALELAATLK